MQHKDIQRFSKPFLDSFARNFYAYISGPPYHPDANYDAIFLGGGVIASLCIVPLWEYLSAWKWSNMYNKNYPKAEPEPKPEEDFDIESDTETDSDTLIETDVETDTETLVGTQLETDSDTM